MTEFLIYDGKVAVALLVFYLFYRFLLKKETFHRFNRVVLVGTAVLSFLLPLCIITIHKPIEVEPVVPEPAVLATELPAQELGPLVETAVPWWPIALIILFWAGVAFVLGRVCISILSIVRIIRRGQLVRGEDGCQIIVTERDIDPFSWMKYIVLSRKDWEAPHESILAHEKSHIGLGHSVEVLLVDVLSALQWFNPAIWMLRADLQELHEYEADDAVLRAGTNIKEYQYLLIRKAVSKSGYSVANSFNHSILKNRITMMSKSKSPLSRGWRVLYLLPLVCLGLGLQARTVYVPIDKDSEKIVFNETGALSGSVWTGEVGKLTFFDTTFEIRTEDEIIRGNYAVDNSTIQFTFTDYKNESNGKEKKGNDKLTGVMDGNTITIPVENGEMVFNKVKKIPAEEQFNYFLPEVVVMKYADASVKPEDVIHVNRVNEIKMTAGKDFDTAPECSENFARWLNSRLRYPADCLYDGTLVAMLVVGEDGKVGNVEIVSGLCEELDKSVADLIGKAPEWTPAKKDGKPVATVLFQPVIFKIRTATTANSTQTSPVVLNVHADGGIEGKGNVVPGAAVIINAEANTPMGIVNDLKDWLREVGALKVYYSKQSETESVMRHIAPSVTNKTLKVQTYDEALKGIDRKDICVARINAHDKIFFESGAYDNDADILRVGKAFLKAHGAKTVITLTDDRGTSYGVYQNLQALLTQIYNEVRDEKAREVYGKSLVDLSEDQRAAILRLVPMTVLETDMKG